MNGLYLFYRGVPVQKVIAYTENETESWILYKYVEGISLKTLMIKGDIQESFIFAKKLAHTLKMLHNCKDEGYPVIKRPSIVQELNFYVDEINKNRVKIPYFKDIVCELKQECKEDLFNSPGVASFVHMDLHSANLIYDINGDIILIDIENVTISDPLRDFSYAYLFHPQEENLLWYATIMEYSGKDIVPESFLKKIKVYSALQYLRIVLHESKKNSNESDFTKKGAESLININNVYPNWMEKYIDHNQMIVEKMRSV